MYYPAAVKSVNLSTPPSLRGRRRGGEGLSALRATSWQTAEKVSHGLGQECATPSVAVDGDGGTEDGGWRWVSWTPGAPSGDDAGTEGQEMGLLHMEVHSYLRQRPARPCVHFLHFKYINKI